MKIDKGIPIPGKRDCVEFHNSTKYPLREMEIGDSFFVSTTDTDNRRVFNTLGSACKQFKKRHAEYNFTVRFVENGVRVWRTAPKART